METLSNSTGTHSKSGVVHLRSLTGMRFLAAFAVFCFHLQGHMIPEIYGWNLGGPAVSFFFVLSGFILTFVYQDRLTRESVPRFLFSRFARLWPLHVVCLMVACFALGIVPTSSWKDANSWFGLGLQSTLLQSWIPGNKWAMEFNAVAWSISTELFFYFCFPLLLLVTGKRVFGWLDAAIVFMAMGLLVGGQHLIESDQLPWWSNAATFAITFPPLRLLEFAMGMVTCRLMFARGHFGGKHRDAKSSDPPATHSLPFVFDSLWEFAAVAAIVVVAMWSHIYRIPALIMHSSWGEMYSLWFRVSAFSPLFAFAIYTFACRQGLLGRILASRLAVWLGEISFAFYLIHQIVILSLNKLTFSDFHFAIYSFLISLFAAALLYAVVEMPSRKYLVSLFERNPDARSDWLAMLAKSCRSGWGRVHLLALLTLLTIICLHPNEQATREAVDRVVQATPDGMRNIYFRQEAWLLGYEAERVPRGVRLRLAWLLERTRYRNRFIHICDAEGNILGQAKFSKETFDRARPYEPFIEEIVLGKRQIKGAAYLAVGFWSKELQSAQTMHPEAEYNSSRIRVVDLRELK